MSFWKAPSDFGVTVLNFFSINGMRKAPKVSIYTCALTIEEMLAAFPGLFPDTQPHIRNECVDLCNFPWNGTRQNFQPYCLSQC